MPRSGNEGVFGAHLFGDDDLHANLQKNCSLSRMFYIASLNIR